MFFKVILIFKIKFVDLGLEKVFKKISSLIWVRFERLEFFFEIC